MADDAMHLWLTTHGSFPKGERPEPYQEYYWQGKWHKGQRDICIRSLLMQFKPTKDEVVYEFGSQMGGFLQLAVLAGASVVKGVEIDDDYVQCSRVLLENMKQPHQCVKVVKGDISSAKELQSIRATSPAVIHHLILASLGKHIGGANTVELILNMFDNAKNIYFETNAVGDKQIEEEDVIAKHGGILVGHSSDRNYRRLWKITK